MCSSPMEAPERGWSRAGSVPPQVRGSAGQRRPVVSRIDPLAAAIFLRWKRSGIGSEIARSIGDSIRLLLASLVRPDHGEPELVRQAIDSIRPHAADPRLARFLDAVDRGDLDAAIAAGREVTGQPTLERMLESDRPARS